MCSYSINSIESILAKIPVLNFETKEARIHAGLFATLVKQGKMIAATAIVHNCAVLTENTSEFKRVPGLETISFVRPL